VAAEAPEQQDGRAADSAERVEDEVGRSVVHADLKVRRRRRVEGELDNLPGCADRHPQAQRRNEEPDAMVHLREGAELG